MVNGMLLLHTVLFCLWVCGLRWTWSVSSAFVHYYHVDPRCLWFHIRNRRKFLTRQKPLYRSSLSLRKRKSLEFTSFITNKKKILSLAPAKRRPKQDLSWPLSISCTRAIFVLFSQQPLPSQWSKGTRERSHTKNIKIWKDVIVIVVVNGYS